MNEHASIETPVIYPSSYETGNLRVLIVEDEVGLASIMRRQLSGAYDVFQVASAEAGVEILEAYPFDVVIADYHLATAGMNGLELLAIVARRWPDTRRVLCTGSEVADWDEDAQQLLRKPYTSASLVEALSD